jgi:hypothetical protein
VTVQVGQGPALQTSPGKVISAVLEPSDDGDKLLREIGRDDAFDVLKAVRELVCGSAGHGTAGHAGS